MDTILKNYITSAEDPFNFVFQNFFQELIGNDEKIMMLCAALPCVTGRLGDEDYGEWMKKTTTVLLNELMLDGQSEGQAAANIFIIKRLYRDAERKKSSEIMQFILQKTASMNEAGMQLMRNCIRSSFIAYQNFLAKKAEKEELNLLEARVFEIINAYVVKPQEEMLAMRMDEDLASELYESYLSFEA